MDVRFPTNVRVVPILLIAIVGMIIIISQSPVAFAGACTDEDEDGYYTVSSPSYCGEAYYRDCDDTDPEVYPGNSPACAFPYKEALGEIKNEVDALIASGNFDINSKQATNLLNRLQKSEDQIEADKINVAINLLNSFINNINAYMNKGAISPYDGDGLIFGVQAVITTLENN